jgi:hypothetical protein
MVILQLLGQVAYIGASLVVGTKLILLWRRTREFPELGVGLAFVLGGGVAYAAWLVFGVATSAGVPRETLSPVLLLGLFATCMGALANGAAIARIYRPGSRWTAAFLGASGVTMAAGMIVTVAFPPPRSSVGFWTGLLAALPIWTWAAGESFALAQTLHRRAKLGLADPVVVSRIVLWGTCMAIVVAMTVISFVGRLVSGPMMNPAVGAVTALLGVAGALAIWLGFFPPRALRERLAREYGS